MIFYLTINGIPWYFDLDFMDYAIKHFKIDVVKEEKVLGQLKVG